MSKRWVVRRREHGANPGPWQYVVSVRETIPGYDLDAWSSKLDPNDPDVKTWDARGEAEREIMRHPSWRDAEAVEVER